MQIQMVTFSAAKDGNAPGEWQDGACGGVVPGGAGAQRPGGAAGPQAPRREPAAMRAWFAEMQDQWAADVRDFDSIIEERKFAEVGSFATLLGFEIHGLEGPAPYWRGGAPRRPGRVFFCGGGGGAGVLAAG